MATEKDPNGLGPHAPGAKLDAGKNRLGLVLRGFARALEAVGDVGTYGAQKYTDNGWKSVPNGVARYTDALYRHLLAEGREAHDPDTEILHAAHAAWNALARLDLMLQEEEDGWDVSEVNPAQTERAVLRKRRLTGYEREVERMKAGLDTLNRYEGQLLVEEAIRARLVEMGWTPPGAHYEDSHFIRQIAARIERRGLRLGGEKDEALHDEHIAHLLMRYANLMDIARRLHNEVRTQEAARQW